MNLQELVTILNNNQGALLSVLTMIYVIATIVTTIFIYRSNKYVKVSNKIAREAIQTSIHYEMERNRPYVIFDFLIENNTVCAILKNIGCTPAINVSLKIDDKVSEIHMDKKLLSFAERIIAFMAPDRTLRDFINTAQAIFSDNQDHIYSIKIKYQDTNKREYEEDFVVDLDHNKGLTYLVHEDYLQKISNGIKETGRYLSEIKHSMESLVWEQNTLIDKQEKLELTEEGFKPTEFLKEYFKNAPSSKRIAYFDLMSHFKTKKAEQVRNNILCCEKLGYLRRERNYFVLTEKGHDVFEENIEDK